MSDDLAAAVAWLDTQERTPLLVVWCPRRGKRCRLGTVYAAPQGLLLEGWQRTKVAVAVDRPSEAQKLRRAVLLTDRDGNGLDVKPYGATCRHGQPTTSGHVDLDAVRSAAREVQTGNATRPGTFTAE